MTSYTFTKGLQQDNHDVPYYWTGPSQNQPKTPPKPQKKELGGRFPIETFFIEPGEMRTPRPT